MRIIIGVLVILVILVLSAVAVTVYGYLTKSPKVGVHDKTFWNWLSILIVPVLLTLGGILFAAYQDIRQQEIENQRNKHQQEIEEQRAQDEALQSYLDQMSTLMLEKDLRDSAPDSEVRTLAHTRTLTLLDSVDAQRRRDALRFLYEANLIDRPDPVIGLEGANLKNMDLKLVNLSGGAFDIPATYGSDRGAEFGGGGADLSGADLSGTNLSFGALQGVDLEGANFRNANLTACGLHPDLSNVPPDALGSAEVRGVRIYPNAPGGVVRLIIAGHVPLPQGAVKTNLQGAFFNHALLRQAVFLNADLSGADFIWTNLRHSWLVAADLDHARFMNSDLTRAKLQFASMHDVNFDGAELKGANLEGVRGLAGEELEEQAKSLEGATMPNGQKYEDWLEDKEGSGEDGKNSSSS